MEYAYDAEQMRRVLSEILHTHLDQAQWEWLEQQQQQYAAGKAGSWYTMIFSAIPRFVGKAIVEPGQSVKSRLQDIRPGFTLGAWPADRLARSWWLLQLPVADSAAYIRSVERLFLAAEMNEQVALYGSLPLLAFPESFTRRCAEGVRTNISSVFEAVALDNPYAAQYLEEGSWNQLVLKAFFMDVAVNRIEGLDQRANPKLAHILSDYAHERWAAGRPVNPVLWRPVGPFIDAELYKDILRLSESESDAEKKAAVLACRASSFATARSLLERFADWNQQAERGELDWESL